MDDNVSNDNDVNDTDADNKCPDGSIVAPSCDRTRMSVNLSVSSSMLHDRAEPSDAFDDAESNVNFDEEDDDDPGMGDNKSRLVLFHFEPRERRRVRRERGSHR